MCGVKGLEEKIKGGLNVNAHNTEAVWHQWENVQTGKTTSKVDKVTKTTSLADLISALLAAMDTFTKHVFTFRFQHMQFKLLQSKLPTLQEKTAVVVIDFSENYLCKHQDEVQAAHWGYNQVTVHPVVIYYACDSCENQLVTEYMIYLSDDLNHDAHIVTLMLQEVQEHLQQSGIAKLIVWSDGCPTHYKSKLPFYLASKQHIERAFFGS